jgi:ubiquinone/menaquinone biosynthesis C-methylase UbiE
VQHRRGRRARAADLGLEIDYRTGDCERLELPDASSDAVASTCGTMFSPDHETTAREHAYVRPGGRLARRAPGTWHLDFATALADYLTTLAIALRARHRRNDHTVIAPSDEKADWSGRRP